MNTMFGFLILAAEVVMMLFQLRSLQQSSSADYYHPITQLTFKVTEPVLKLLPFKNQHLGQFFYAGVLCSLGVGLLFWAVMFVMYFSEALSILHVLELGCLMTVKVFGYLLIVVLIVQALTSWLPSTRALSMYFYQLSAPIVAPVQKIIPPIGMIDISLMIILLVIYALNRLLFNVFGPIWLLL